MERSSAREQSSWQSAAFPVRLAADYCLYLLLGEASDPGPGPVRTVQIQAPQRTDDLLVEFDTGAHWHSLAISGFSAPGARSADNPFGQALAQLHTYYQSQQFDPAYESLDRLILALEDGYPSLASFKQWIERAHRYAG